VPQGAKKSIKNRRIFPTNQAMDLRPICFRSASLPVPDFADVRFLRLLRLCVFAFFLPAPTKMKSRYIFNIYYIIYYIIYISILFKNKLRSSFPSTPKKPMAQKRKGAKGAKNAHRHIRTEKYLLPHS
jgi:hypothetical protein